MAVRFNPFTGNLDIVSNSSSGVTGIAPTTDKAITRWQGTTGTVIQNSGSYVQDGGAVETEGIIVQSIITTIIDVPDTKAMICPALSIQPGGIINLGQGSQLIIV